MARSDLLTGLKLSMSYRERQAHEAAVRAAANTALDFPVLPTSGTDATPLVPEEPDDNLSPAQRLAVAALVSGQTFVAAARAANVSRRTIYAWRQEPAFQAAVETTSREAMAAVVVRVRNLMLRATRVLGETMDAGGATGSVQAFRVLNSKQLWTTAVEPPPDAGSSGGEG